MSNASVPSVAPARGLPIARVRDIFNPDDVQQRLQRLRAQGHEREQATLC